MPMPRGKRAESKTPTVDYAAGCLVRSTSTKCPTKKSRTSSSPPISRPENAWASRPLSRRSSKSLAKTCKSGSLSLLHLDLESRHPLYRGMEFTEDKKTLRDWIPLVMEGRPDSDTVAATRMITGADVNYGALTRNLIAYLQTLSGFAVRYSRRVTGLQRVDGGRWRVDAVDTTNNAQASLTARFVFL